ncbi:MAG: decaprenylphospho-beta-D-ribofuranose 2-oxidase [Acidobacteriota bacterium]|jgi:FAD/FMN-containing dehydrogenase|nr:decaprenylphospho-beta-D-ribofuranose 2-oxidase [Acidobacteriota bacterium]
MHGLLRTASPWRVLDGFGRSVRAACRYAAPRDAAELAALLARALEEGLSVTFRGSGKSYGDAALNGAGLVVDLTRFNRTLCWDPEEGVIEAEPGLTIEGLWRRTIEDGYWPAVVPGTMFPTLAGCLAMNIHGKNNFRVGTIGDQVLEFDLLTPRGETLRCSRAENADVFHSVIGGAGLLGAITRVRLKLKKIESGLLRVEPLLARSFGQMFDLFEERLPAADYLVGWIDAWSEGRGLIHQANYLPGSEDPQGPASLHVERQGLPPRILGLPRSQIWRGMTFFMNDPGVRLTNFAKYHLGRVDRPGKTYLQSHVAFAFLLDYIPNWRLAYGPQGLVQYQLFVPKEEARRVMPEILKLCRERGIVSSLGVLKRHRPDPFLLTHALDGYSLALDFRVATKGWAALQALGHEMTARVLDSGGSFYLAKDALLDREEIARAYGERLVAFQAMKRRLDPDGVLTSDLARRLLDSGQGEAAERPALAASAAR